MRFHAQVFLKHVQRVRLIRTHVQCENHISQMLSIYLKNSCLVVLHCPHLILKNWKKVLTVYIKYTLNRIPKEFFNQKTKIWTELSQAQLDFPTDH